MNTADRSGLAGVSQVDMAWGLCAAVGIGLTLYEVGFPRGAPAAGLAAIAILIARSDWRERIIPNAASLSAAVLALVEALLDNDPKVALVDALVRGAAVLALFLGFRFTYRYWRGREGMGLGDVKLAGVLGMWLDWPYVSLAIELACVSAIAYVLLARFGSHGRFDALTRLPFGAFLAPSIWATWMWAQMAA